MAEQPTSPTDQPEQPKPTGVVTLANVAPLFLAPRR